MRYGKAVILILIVLLFSGCIEEITARFQKVQVVYANVSVVMKENQTVIQSIEAKGSEVTLIDAPGVVSPGKFPAIYVEVLQVYNNTKALKVISLPNGQVYNGPGNYSFTVQLFEGSLNNSQPINVYSEIQQNMTRRLTRQSAWFNWTE